MFKKILLLALIFSLFLSSFGLVSAARGPRSNLGWPPSPRIPPTILTIEYPAGSGIFYFREGIDTPMVIQYFYEWIIVLGGLAVFIAFIWAGLLYMTSVGDANKMSEAKKKIKNAIIGLVLLLSSWLIFNEINPELNVLRKIDITQPPIEVITGKDQKKINSFRESYVHCNAHRVILGALPVVRLGTPLGYIQINIAELLNMSKPSPINPPYESFIINQTAKNCEELNNLIRIPGNSFSRLPPMDINCIWNANTRRWIPPTFQANDQSDPEVIGECRMVNGRYQVQIKRWLVIRGKRIRNYRDLISTLILPW